MSKELWDMGLAVRKEVLGAEYVERNLASADDFNMPMQELVTQSCLGWLWARPQMSRKMRSLINLGILSALNRPHEFKAHMKVALTNGCSREEIRADLIKVAVSCSMPAGVETYKIAREGITEYEEGKRRWRRSTPAPPAAREEDLVESQRGSPR